MDYDDTLEQMNITLGDSEDVTFTPEEKERALTKAWNDPFVYKTVFESSLTFVTNTFTYVLPSGVTTVKDVLYSSSSTEANTPLPGDMWDVVNGSLYINKGADGNYLTNGKTIVLKCNQKLDPDTDTITNESMQEYVIALACTNTLSLLTYKKANLFLKNDTTMGELIALKRELQSDVQRMRLLLPKEYETA